MPYLVYAINVKEYLVHSKGSIVTQVAQIVLILDRESPKHKKDLS